MLLFVGLGNPTPDSENNRHNIGFKLIDALNQKFGLSKQKPKFKGLLTTGIISEHKVYAIKPLTFMNNSGTAIKELIDYFKIDAKDVIVFHDDLDIDFGKIAKSFNYTKVFRIEKINEFNEIFMNFQKEQGPCLLEIIVNKGARKELGRPTVSPKENKINFMSFIK